VSLSGLTNAGHEVFIDIRIAVGTDWASELIRRIEWCDFLVVLLSARSVYSEMVCDEIRLAHEIGMRNGKSRILPIRVDYDGPLG
jgi:TIR domain